MPITVTCRRCNHEFSAWDDLAGQLVPCPQCDSDVFVGDEEEWDEEDDDEEDDEFQLAPAEESLLSPTSMALPVAGDEPAPAQAAADGDEVPADCPKCGAGLEGEMLCEACGYHVKLRRTLASDLDTFEPNRNLGFKRWFNSQLSEGESFDSVFFWAKIVFGFMLAGFTLFFFPYSLLITIPVVMGIVVAYVSIKRGAKSGDDAFYDAGTRMSLRVVRGLGWRRLSWPFPKVSHYSARKTDFNDDDLAQLENTGEIEALDLEGCHITDAGLKHLTEWEQLRYLVLTDTDTSRDAVVELQMQLNKTMIWW